MLARAQLSVTELRRAVRHPVDFSAIGDHRLRGDVELRIVNVSAHGFMICGGSTFDRGERVTVRLPEIGRIEAFVVWKTEDRAGLQFERIIRPELFCKMVDAMQPGVRMRIPRRHRSP